ncbi:hypothetical protein LTR10_008705 [Elasticomyces elasticus]|nr:hypothetical protein LTR10_008705 [Elasticomyces elasticus]KAK4974321.1 hypothetical protein LTR42_004963 [Elasticomyces elasticus]
MSSRKLGNTGQSHRTLTLEDRVNKVAGEDSLSDSDDLHMVPKKGKKKGDVELDDYLDSFGAGGDEVVSISSSPSTSDKNERKRGERIAFSSDDEAGSDAGRSVYETFKKRKTVKRQKAQASTARAKSRIKNASLVGRKPKTVIALKKTNRKDGEKVYSDDVDENDALMEDTLPDYLKSRRSDRETHAEKRERLKNTTGLLLPPEYDDLSFKDCGPLASLAERPQLPETARQRDYADIELPHSLGVIPAPIAQYLRPYQRGGILGDDMGLGKTIQVIAFLTAAFGKTGDERDDKRMRKIRRLAKNGEEEEDRWYPRILLICPGSLMANWKQELSKWGWWHTYTYHGSKAEKEACLSAAKTGMLEIMITTYDSYRLNCTAINSIRWDAVIADECHKIKEVKAEITRAMNDVNALCRIGMTGTAIQNKYEELWTLLNWSNPGHFGPMSTWKQSICLPLKMGQSHDASYAQLAKARRTAEKLVHNLLPPFFLRRTKALLADQLPKKSDRVVFCPLTETQGEAYNNICDSEVVRRIRESGEPCTCGSGKKQGWCCYAFLPDGRKWQHFVFPAIMTLQKLSNHLALLIPAGEADKERHDKDIEVLEIAVPKLWRELYRERDSIVNYANAEFCGKWRVLKKLLKLWSEMGDKVLVFSHSVRLLRMLRLLFTSTTSYNVSYLDGSMSYPDRQATVDSYNSDPSQFVFLISTKAGGVGLNITSANKVVVVDPNWNPSYDLQAQDRAYRIGQERDVEVFRLVSRGSVEEIVYARQIYKQQQARIGYDASVERRYFRGVQDRKEMKGEIFGLANLFAPMSENVVLKEIVNKTNVAETRAGVEIAGLDLEAADEEDDVFGAEGGETAVMSQLAKEIVGEKKVEGKKKRDPVSAILASVGVEYTHENSEVVGTSKIEQRISSRAQKAGNDVEFDQDRAFGQQASQSQAAAAGGGGYHPVYGAAKTEVGGEDEEGKVRYRYKPPEEVRRRQFCSMAKKFGYGDVTEFALVVEGWTQEQRRNCLDEFYRERRGVLMAGDKDEEEDD